VVAPVIRHADRVSLGEIARQRLDLADRARSGKLRPADLTGGTFTISNLGMFGVDSFTAIIIPPQAANPRSRSHRGSRACDRRSASGSRHDDLNVIERSPRDRWRARRRFSARPAGAIGDPRKCLSETEPANSAYDGFFFTFRRVHCACKKTAATTKRPLGAIVSILRHAKLPVANGIAHRSSWPRSRCHSWRKEVRPSSPTIRYSRRSQLGDQRHDLRRAPSRGAHLQCAHSRPELWRRSRVQLHIRGAVFVEAPMAAHSHWPGKVVTGCEVALL